ncbi:MAG: DUF4405 domain-containing protein [Pseudomonadota bacterium]
MSTTVRAVTGKIVTPVTLALFLASAITGIMLLVHWQSGLVQFAHEWLGVGFAAIAIWHIVKHRRALTHYLRKDLPVAAFALALGAAAVLTALTGTAAPGGPGNVLRAVAEAPLEAAAPAFGLTVETAVARLEAEGIDVASSETLAQIARRTGLPPMQVLNTLARPEIR